MIDTILSGYEEILHVLAKLTVHTLEIIGITIVIIGSFKVVYSYLRRHSKKGTHEHQNAVIALGRSLALALEFKMGAEIVNTVIIRELKELLILGIVIILRAILAVLIHWEITTEEKEEKAHLMAKSLILEEKTKDTKQAESNENNS